MSQLSKDGKVYLRSLLSGDLGNLLEDLRAEAKDILTQTVGLNLDLPDELAKAKNTQALARGFFHAADRIKELLEEDID